MNVFVEDAPSNHIYRNWLYPGSFNPWHAGHQDIMRKALLVCDEVTVCRMVNPDKAPVDGKEIDCNDLLQAIYYNGPFGGEGKRFQIVSHTGLLVDAVKKYDASAVIRGLRNGSDLQYEMNLQYWNEDLGIQVPTVCFMTDRSLVHISSSSIRSMEKFKK